MTIAICGSMQFSERMLAVQRSLTQLGHQAFVTHFASRMVGKADAALERLKLQQKFNDDAIREHWRLMQGKDAILVLNYDKHGITNYIGGNTLMEIGFAHVLNQKIFLLNPIPDIPYYRSEIEAVRPVVLHGDLTKIR